MNRFFVLSNVSMKEAWKSTLKEARLVLGYFRLKQWISWSEARGFLWILWIPFKTQLAAMKPAHNRPFRFACAQNLRPRWTSWWISVNLITSMILRLILMLHRAGLIGQLKWAVGWIGDHWSRSEIKRFSLGFLIIKKRSPSSFYVQNFGFLEGGSFF